MTTTTPDVEQQLRIDAPPETVWAFWTRPDRLCEWWGTAEAVAEVGGGFVVTMESGGVMRGEYVDARRAATDSSSRSGGTTAARAGTYRPAAPGWR